MDVIVSVICKTYNHEKYISKCINSLLNQKTNFKYEILIHDDASTDKTALIVKEYEQKYPNIIKAVYQKENKYSKKIPIIPNFLLPIASGKFLAFCEGDDFWIDENKLQTQVDALEDNPDCYLCVHTVQATNENGFPVNYFYPINKYSNGMLNSDSFIKILCYENFAFQLSSFLLKKEKYEYYINNIPKFRQVSCVGDLPLMLYFGSIGNVYYINKVMSCYRLNSINNWSNKGNESNSIYRYRCNSLITMFNEFDKFTNFKYHDLCEHRISLFEFNNHIHFKDYKSALRKKYSQIRKKRSFLENLKLYVKYILSFFNDNYKKINETE